MYVGDVYREDAGGHNYTSSWGPVMWMGNQSASCHLHTCSEQRKLTCTSTCHVTSTALQPAPMACTHTRLPVPVSAPKPRRHTHGPGSNFLVHPHGEWWRGWLASGQRDDNSWGNDSGVHMRNGNLRRGTGTQPPQQSWRRKWHRSRRPSIRAGRAHCRRHCRAGRRHGGGPATCGEVGKKTFHGDSMEIPWRFHGDSMEIPWKSIGNQ